MKILEFEYEDLVTGWKLERVQFNDFNLLVGASGVGKSMILKKLFQVLRIAAGEDVIPAKWTLKFEFESNLYEWQFIGNPEDQDHFEVHFEYERDLHPNDYHGSLHHYPYVKEESLICKDQIIFSREDEKRGMIYNGASLDIALKEIKSLFDIISDGIINRIRISLSDVYFFTLNGFYGDSLKHATTSGMFSSKVKTEFIQKSTKNVNGIDTPVTEIPLKLLYFFQEEKHKIFSKIANDFIIIFDTVESIKIIKGDSGFRDDFSLVITEKDCDVPIPLEDISQGMLTVFMHIVILELAPKNSVILIDEIENSLGVNCLDLVVDLFYQSDRNHQFILTSHHPDVINEIEKNKWKIIMREGKTVRAFCPEELGMKESRHDRYIQLINNPAYSSGKMPQKS